MDSSSFCDSVREPEARFYFSRTINNVQHARSLRNSVLLSESAYDTNSASGSTTAKEATAMWDGSIDASREILDDDSSVEDETQTQTLKMTTSPSLSALAGILQEKSQRAEKRMLSNSMALDSFIAEEEVNSPDLLNVNDESVLLFKKQLPESNFVCHYKSIEPDFLSSPVLEPQHARTLNTKRTSDEEAGSPISDTHTSSSTNSMTRTRSRSINSEFTGQTATSVSGVSATSGGPGKPKESDSKTHSQKKRRSVFSFLRRKSVGSSLVQSVTSNGQQGLPTSSTFSVGKTTRDSLDSSTQLQKKSYSSNSLFSSLRLDRVTHNSDKKDSTEASSSQRKSLVMDKLRGNTKSRINSSRKHGNLGVREELKQRKPTPLDMSLAYKPAITPPESGSSSGAVATQVPPLVPSKPDTVPVLPRATLTVTEASNVSSRRNSGEALFPKSLDAQEVESIISLERSRSQKSQRASVPASKRRSLTDNISIKAQNEGMFVTEAPGVTLSTPDLTKSPASSILRNGTFDPADNALRNSDIDTADYGFDMSLSCSADLDDDENGPAISFSSVQEKLNELTLDIETKDDDGEGGQPNKKHWSSVQSNVPESDLIDDIMEFANIIDFGDDLDFDLNLNTSGTVYKTLNPSVEIQKNGVCPPATMNGTTPRSSFSPKHSLFEEPRRITIGGDFMNDSNIKPLVDPYDDELDINEFADVGAIAYASNITTDPYLPTRTSSNRPISMSFRGLTAPQFNSSYDLSRLNSELELSTYTLGRDGATVRFSSRILLHDTYSEEEYDRHPEVSTCNQLTPQLAQFIREEMNQVKSEMDIHEDSRCYTHFL